MARTGKHQEAVSGFDQLLARDSDHAEARIAKTFVLFLLKQPREGLANIDDWLEKHPTKANYTRAADALEAAGLQKQADILRDLRGKLEK